MTGSKKYSRDMVFILAFILAAFYPISFVCAQDLVVPKDRKEKRGYSIGVDVGRNVKEAGIEIDADMVARGVRDGYAGRPRLKEAEMKTILADINQQIQNKRNEKVRNLAEKNKKDGDAFLREHAKKTGVVVLPSGVQYRAIKEGTGSMPKPNDTVIVHYRSALIDGTEYDSSRARNQPVEFVLGDNVLKGWFEVIQKMKVGSRWLVVVPSSLAYGEKGGGGVVGPNTTLMFDLELLDIK